MPIPINVEQEIIFHYKQYCLGAVNSAKLLKSKGVKITYHNVHIVLRTHGLALKEPKKSKQRK